MGDTFNTGDIGILNNIKDSSNFSITNNNNSNQNKSDNKNSFENELDIPSGNYSVVKADVNGYSNYMKQGHGETIKNKIKELLETHCKGFVKVEPKDGDSFSIIDKETDKILKALIRISDDLRDEHPIHPLLRIAVDFGTIAPNDKMILRKVARIEPIVIPAGKIWVTERFRAMLSESYQRKLIDLGNKKINKEHEPDEYEHLFEVKNDE